MLPGEKRRYPSDERDRSEYQKAYQKRIRKVRIELNLCIRCGRRKDNKQFRTCLACRLEKAEWERRMRAKKKKSLVK